MVPGFPAEFRIDKERVPPCGELKFCRPLILGSDLHAPASNRHALFHYRFYYIFDALGSLSGHECYRFWARSKDGLVPVGLTAPAPADSTRQNLRPGPIT